MIINDRGIELPILCYVDDFLPCLSGSFATVGAGHAREKE
jgi:hypothetical protein